MIWEMATKGPLRCPSASTSTGGSAHSHAPSTSRKPHESGRMIARMSSRRPRRSRTHIAPLQSSMSAKSPKTSSESVRSLVKSSPGGMGFISARETVWKRMPLSPALNSVRWVQAQRIEGSNAHSGPWKACGGTTHHIQLRRWPVLQQFE